MVHAEKIVTAIARGTVNTRWRDFADIYMLARHHAIAGTELVRSTRRVAEHRQVQLVPLAQALVQLRADRPAEMDGVAPPAAAGGPTAEPFGDVIAAVIDFADPAIIGSVDSRSWDPATQNWR